MKRFDDLGRALLWLGALALAGCGAQQAGITAISPASGAANLAANPRADRVFVSDPGTSEVYLYDVSTLKLIEIVTGFTQPQGECTDDKGDVFVADGSGKDIIKLLHSGRMVAKLADSYGVPIGCAWDFKTGNLAVMNLLGNESQGGAILIYHHASGVPNVYTNPKQYSYYFGGYDGAGDLFFDGQTAQSKFILSELPVNASQAKTIAVSGAQIYTPGMVQWDAAASQLVVGDQNCGNGTVSCLYQITIAKNEGTITGKIDFRNATGGSVCDLIQGVLWKKKVVGSDFDSCGSQHSATYVWPYPAGGEPKAENTRYDSEPFGAAISTESGSDAAPAPDSIAKKVDLLYVSDGNGEVTVYTYWQKSFVRTLTGFTQPMGECVNAAGDVFITDYGARDVVEYAHDGKTPIATIDDSPYAPYACSVDLATGTLAVANEAGGSTQGNIAVYAGLKSPPAIYTDATIGDFRDCAYDRSGNLLASNGEAGSEYASFAWLPKGGGKLVNVTLPGPEKSWVWEDVNGIQWDGRYFVIDVAYAGVYRETVSDGQGYYVGATYFDEADGAGPFWIYDLHPNKQGTQIVGVYDSFGSSSVYYWNYPAGGDAIASISKDLYDPVAVAVSLGKVHE